MNALLAYFIYIFTGLILFEKKKKPKFWLTMSHLNELWADDFGILYCITALII